MEDIEIHRTFSVADYVVFGSMLSVSAIIGIFYAIKDRNSTNGTEGYLLAGRSMNVIPVGISLAVSFQSSVTILGIPADVYEYGIMYMWVNLSLVISCVLVAKVFLPTFYRLKISSQYEYLERRFNKTVRLVATTTFILQNIIYLGVNTYGPALALSEVTGFDLTTAMLTTGSVCAFYTTLGGLKAVIWTDVFQGLIMAAGMIIFIIRGSMLLGGFENAWKIAEKGGRTEILKFDTDPRIRYTFWSVVVGFFGIWLGVFGANQSQIQRYLCMKSEKKAKHRIFWTVEVNKGKFRALYLGVVGISFYSTLACTCGLLIYAYYSHCDPLSNNCVQARDQIMPYMVMDIFRDFNYGLPGLYLACVFSSSLSTVSSGLNAMVTVSLEDFIKPYTSWTERSYTILSKGITIFFGGIVLASAFCVSIIGDILSVVFGMFGAFTGSTLGVFMLGIWFPFINSVGALTGLLWGITTSMWLYMGSRGISKSDAFLQKLVVNTDQCTTPCGYMNFDNMSAYFNHSSGVATMEPFTIPPPPELGFLESFYSISSLYTASFSLTASLLIGIFMSLLTCGWRQRETDKTLTKPTMIYWLCSWFSVRSRKYLRCGVGKQEENIYDKEENHSLEEMNINTHDHYDKYKPG